MNDDGDDSTTMTWSSRSPDLRPADDRILPPLRQSPPTSQRLPALRDILDGTSSSSYTLPALGPLRRSPPERSSRPTPYPLPLVPVPSTSRTATPRTATTSVVPQPPPSSPPRPSQPPTFVYQSRPIVPIRIPAPPDPDSRPMPPPQPPPGVRSSFSPELAPQTLLAGERFLAIHDIHIVVAEACKPVPLVLYHALLQRPGERHELPYVIGDGREWFKTLGYVQYPNEGRKWGLPTRDWAFVDCGVGSDKRVANVVAKFTPTADVEDPRWVVSWRTARGR